jgi:hypothetical protein
MKYQVTAIKPVEILAKVRREDAHAHSGGHVTRPAESYEWIYLNAGEVRDGLRAGKETVLLPLNDKLPKVYFDLFELENSTISD